MDSVLTCCLCSFVGVNESDLETHIDYAHPDIFQPAIKVEPESETSDLRSAIEPTITKQEYEIGRIQETYEQLLNQPGFRCSMCGFFTMTLDVLNAHMTKNHSRQVRNNPSLLQQPRFSQPPTTRFSPPQPTPFTQHPQSGFTQPMPNVHSPLAMPNQPSNVGNQVPTSKNIVKRKSLPGEDIEVHAKKRAINSESVCMLEIMNGLNHNVQQNEKSPVGSPASLNHSQVTAQNTKQQTDVQFKTTAVSSQNTKTPKQALKTKKNAKADTPYPSKYLQKSDGTLIKTLSNTPLVPAGTMQGNDDIKIKCLTNTETNRPQNKGSLVITNKVKTPNEEQVASKVENYQGTNLSATRKLHVIVKPNTKTQSPALKSTEKQGRTAAPTTNVKNGVKNMIAQNHTSTIRLPVHSTNLSDGTIASYVQRSEYDKLHSELSAVKFEKKNIREMLIDLGRLRVDLANANVENKKLKEKMGHMESELSNSRLESRKMKEKVMMFDRVAADLVQIKSENEKLVEAMVDFEQIEVNFDNLKAENEEMKQEIIGVKAQLDQLKSEEDVFKAKSMKEIQQLKLNLKLAAVRNQEQLDLKSGQIVEVEKERDSISYYLNKVEAELSEQKAKNERDFISSQEAMASVHNLSNSLKMRSSQISQLMLNQERYELEIKKLEKELAKARESFVTNSDYFIAIKDTLENVIKDDNNFCKAYTSGDKFETLQDSELAEIVNFILRDFVASKKQMMSDLHKCQSRLTGQSSQRSKEATLKTEAKYKEKEKMYRKQIESLQNTNMNLLRKAGNNIIGKPLELNKPPRNKEEEYIREISKLKLMVTSQNKLVNVLQKCTTVLGNKSSTKSGSWKVANHGGKIIVGNKVLSRNGGKNDSEIIKIFTSEMSMRENLHSKAIKNYITQLDQYKNEVKEIITQKNDKISELSRQVGHANSTENSNNNNIKPPALSLNTISNLETLKSNLKSPITSTPNTTRKSLKTPPTTTPITRASNRPKATRRSQMNFSGITIVKN